MKKQVTIKATPNYKERTFTIRKYFPDGTISKYRTVKMDIEEFESCEYNTENDWAFFLRSQDGDYYSI